MIAPELATKRKLFVKKSDLPQTYLELVDEASFRFAESFDVDHENNRIIVPMQLKDMTTSIFSIDIATKNVTKLGDLIESTVFGCSYDNGKLYCAVFNRSRVVVFDTGAGKVTTEYEVYAPNDVCVDENYIYVACGKKRFFLALPTLGCVLRIHKTTGKKSIFLDNQTTLSGIQYHEGGLYISRLYDVIRVDVKTKRILKISDCNYDSDESYLSDNMFLDNQILYVSLYRKLDEKNLLQMKTLNTVGYALSTLFTQCVNGLSGGVFNLSNPEQLLELSKGDTMVNIVYLKYYIKENRMEFIEMEPQQSDGHYTEFGEYKGLRIGINFLHNKVFLQNIDG